MERQNFPSISSLFHTLFHIVLEVSDFTINVCRIKPRMAYLGINNIISVVMIIVIANKFCPSQYVAKTMVE